MSDKIPKKWLHNHPVSITSGNGSIDILQDILPPEGKILLITTPGFTRRGETDNFINIIGKQRTLLYDKIAPNPQISDLDNITQKFSVNSEISGIVALGGGSVIDSAKVLGVTLVLDDTTQIKELIPYPLYNIFIKQRPFNPSQVKSKIPVIAIPTTSGTGAEVTPFATIWDQNSKKKFSLSHFCIYPSHAILDPALTLPLPYNETLYSGLDAISHALESLWNINRTPITAALALQSLSITVKALPMVLENPAKLYSRTLMQEASLLAGMAISQSRTAIAHAISYPLTIHKGVPHGLACSFTLPRLARNYLSRLDKKHNNMSGCIEKKIIEGVFELLQKINLPKEIYRYIKDSDILQYIPEMFHPERAANYSEDMDYNLLTQLLKQSLEI
ncbi:Alcohol dehydrogenase [Desulfamplus magnetovallimortis]|uniref:Alcohol dehydrogenase n=1 Tax=Desulfamplus magnetovallimortis TaxID=1246637 RepID=A0A1W1HEB1_9BACT|nr:phosphonoacetaldehyde reductase [Desulfamplus magnetovallimortis]SLM30728.1 Alcohol dehydrogenase [Desulfamplus magnetovallimortis]